MIRPRRMSTVALLAALVAATGVRTLAHAQLDAPAEEAPHPSATEADASVDAPDTDETSDADTSGLESLLGEEVVTTASRSAERSSAAPATVITIDGESIRRFGMRSIDEALANLGVGFFVSDPSRDYNSRLDVGVQGVLLRDRGKHVLVLIDGHVTNAQTSGESTLDIGLGVPLELIDHIEVMLGPGSVVYGSNAVQAVVNVVTRRARDYGGYRVVAEGTVTMPLDGHGHAASPGGGDRLGGRYRIGAGFSRAGTFVGRPAEIVVHGEYQQELSATDRVAYQTGDYFDVRPGEAGWGGIQRFRMRSPSMVATARLGNVSLLLAGNSYYRTTPFVGTFQEPSTFERAVTLRGELRHEAALGDRFTLTSRLYGDHVRTDERSTWIRSVYCVPGQIDGCRFLRRNASSWGGVEERLVADWRNDGRYVTTVGGDLRVRLGFSRPADYYDRVTGEAPATARLPYWQSTSVLGAVFVQQTLQPVDRLIVNVGARFDADSLFGVHVSPRIAVGITATERLNLRVAYSQAFRAPSALELYDTDPTYVIRPDRLKAEIVDTVETEATGRWAHGTLSGRLFATFYSGMLNLRTVTQPEFDAAYATGQLVSTADAAFVSRWDNLGRIRVLGGTMSGRYEPIAGLELAGSFTLGQNQTGSDDHRLPIIPAFYGNARVSYRFAQSGLTLAVASVFGAHRTAWDGFGDGTVATRSAGGVGDLRFTASGPIVAASGWSWRASAFYAVNGRGAYLYSLGPTGVNPATNTTVHSPVYRTYLFFGVQHELR